MLTCFKSLGFWVIEESEDVGTMLTATTNDTKPKLTTDGCGKLPKGKKILSSLDLITLSLHSNSTLLDLFTWYLLRGYLYPDALVLLSMDPLPTL